MTKQSLKDTLETSFQSIVKNIEDLDEATFFAPIGEKWSVAENILHLTQSAKGFNQGLGLPKAVLERQFGKIDRPPMNYDEVIQRYLTVLGTGIVATGAFVPVLPENPSKAILLSSFLKHHQILADFLNEWTEEDLDTFCVKHPVLKLMTIREMYYFMDYHINHHKKAINKVYALA